MNKWKIKSIQRGENEGGALLPRDSNVHFWNYRRPEPGVPAAGSDRPRAGRREDLVLAQKPEHHDWNSEN